jgi:hypothetical protein
MSLWPGLVATHIKELALGEYCAPMAARLSAFTRSAMTGVA